MNDETSNMSDDQYPDLPDKELAKLWNQQEAPMSYTADPRELTQLVASIKTTHRSEQLKLMWLNVRELTAFVFLSCFYSYLAVTQESASVLVLSVVLCVGAALFMAGSSVRQHRIEQQFDTTMRGSIERSLSQAKHRFWMFRNTGWWYFLPIAVSSAIFYGWVLSQDPEGAKSSDYVFIAAMVVLFLGLHWWNRRIAFTKWKPEVDRLEALLADMKEPQG